MTGHLYRQRVYLEDVDALGCMYHANHLKLCERARTEMLKQQGFNHASSIKDQQHFVIRKLSIDYKAPVFLDDCIDIETMITDVKLSQLNLCQMMRRDNIVVGQLVVQLVFVDNTFKILKMPQNLHAVFQHLCFKSQLNKDFK